MKHYALMTIAFLLALVIFVGLAAKVDNYSGKRLIIYNNKAKYMTEKEINKLNKSRASEVIFTKDSAKIVDLKEKNNGHN